MSFIDYCTAQMYSQNDLIKGPVLVEQHLYGATNRDGASMPIQISIGYYGIRKEVPMVKAEIIYHPSLKGLIEVS